jgi:hypothetical protein
MKDTTDKIGEGTPGPPVFLNTITVAPTPLD